MITQGVFGGLSSVCFGTADFMGRFSSRAIDHHNALLGMLVAGFVPLSAWVLFVHGLPDWDNLSTGWILLNGIATTAMLLLLYQALARGPITIVAAIVATHPILVILYYALSHGEQPNTVQWLAMAVTIAGTLLVALNGTENPEYDGEQDGEQGGVNGLRLTVFIALGSSIAYAAMIISGQTAMQVHGEFHTLWMGRIVSMAFLLMLFAMRRRAPSVPLRWWPFLCAQGMLDAGGYMALLAGSTGSGKQIVTVIAATFGAVTIMLARIILKEIIRPVQWLGIALVFAGVMVLSH